MQLISSHQADIRYSALVNGIYIKTWYIKTLTDLDTSDICASFTDDNNKNIIIKNQITLLI